MTGQTTRTTCRSVLLALALGATAVDAAAQRFGQWSWDAFVKIGQQRLGSSIGDATQRTYGNRHLTLGLGVNGFILHPTVARFHLGAELNTSRFDEGGAGQNWRDLGLSGELNLFPYGAKRFSLFASRRSFDYAGAGIDDPLLTSTRPDSVTTLGAKFRSRGGSLRGLSVDADRTSLDYLVHGGQRDVIEREAVDWSGGGRGILHHYRIQRELRDYGYLAFSSEELTAILDQHGALSPVWRFDLSGSAIQRTFRAAQVSPTNRVLQLRSQLERSECLDHVTTLAYELGLAVPSQESTSQSHSLSVRHRWRVTPGLTIQPLVSFGSLRNGDVTVSVPGAGLGAALSGRLGFFSGNVIAGVTHRRLRASGPKVQPDQSSLATSLGGSLSGGDESRLRVGLDAEWSRDDLQLAGTSVESLPDLGATLGAGSEHRTWARVTLGHTGDRGGRFLLYSEATRRDVTPLAWGASYRLDTQSHSLSGTWRRISGTLNAGTTEVSGSAASRVEFLAADVSFGLTRFVAVHASHRRDQRRVTLGPDIDRVRTDLAIELTAGALILRVNAYEDGERPVGSQRRTNRGVAWTLTRPFAGWLPIVSAPERRGVIR